MLAQPMAGMLPSEGDASRKLRIPAATQAATGVAAEDFEAIVREHQQRIYRLLMALTRDADAADTLTQECFLRAYRKRATFRGEARIGTWLVRIAINLAKDHARSRRRAFWRMLMGGSRAQAETDAQHAFEVADPGADPEQAAAARQQLAAVWDAADHLSQQQRTVFLLRFAQEMSLQEIAGATDLEVGTVKAHLFRAIGAVRRRLAPLGQNARLHLQGRTR
ncbi:MAG: RNA polymerase sigma factor [Candidatus Acidiferrales bacterium]